MTRRSVATLAAVVTMVLLAPPLEAQQSKGKDPCAQPSKQSGASKVPQTDKRKGGDGAKADKQKNDQSRKDRPKVVDDPPRPKVVDNAVRPKNKPDVAADKKRSDAGPSKTGQKPGTADQQAQDKKRNQADQQKPATNCP